MALYDDVQERLGLDRQLAEQLKMFQEQDAQVGLRLAFPNGVKVSLGSFTVTVAADGKHVYFQDLRLKSTQGIAASAPIITSVIKVNGRDITLMMSPE